MLVVLGIQRGRVTGVELISWRYPLLLSSVESSKGLLTQEGVNTALDLHKNTANRRNSALDMLARVTHVTSACKKQKSIASRYPQQGRNDGMERPRIFVRCAAKGY